MAPLIPRKPRIFISYRRIPSGSLAQLAEVKLGQRGIQSFVDTRSIDGAGPFPNRLRKAIEEADVFVCLLSDSTLDSAWVREEIAHAVKQGKPLIPVFQERYTAPNPIPTPAVEVLLQSDGVHIYDVKNTYIDEAFGTLAQMVKKTAPSGTWWPLAAIAALVLAVAAGVLLIPRLIEPSNATPTTTLVAVEPTATPTSPLIPPGPVQLAQATQTQAAAETLTALPTPTLTPSLTATPTPNTTETQAALNATIAVINTRAAADATATRIAAIVANLPTVTANDRWTPVFETVDAVEMALVPPGCFMMGSTTGESDEAPVQQVCFTAPFWIDRYEVSNGQYQRVTWQAPPSDFSGDALPVETITWYDARDYCAGRGARLPTEVEWEYAARGPSGWVYPYGDTFDAAITVEVSDANTTQDVTSFAANASWVGAQHLSGNVYEWVSSAYKPYPYNPDDGREIMNDEQMRVVRGGSFNNSSNNLRAANRYDWYPTYDAIIIGFRCALSR